jgi:hypothetical protein
MSNKRTALDKTKVNIANLSKAFIDLSSNKAIMESLNELEDSRKFTFMPKLKGTTMDETLWGMAGGIMSGAAALSNLRLFNVIGYERVGQLILTWGALTTLAAQFKVPIRAIISNLKLKKTLEENLVFYATEIDTSVSPPAVKGFTQRCEVKFLDFLEQHEDALDAAIEKKIGSVQGKKFQKEFTNDSAAKMEEVYNIIKKIDAWTLGILVGGGGIVGAALSGDIVDKIRKESSGTSNPWDPISQPKLRQQMNDKKRGQDFGRPK